MNIYVIIATSFLRNDLLITRSLKSVYKQLIDNKEDIKVIIVDDNEIEQTETLKIQVENLRTNLKLNQSEFETILIPNTRIKFQSGTGAWNTGVFYVRNFENWKNSFIAILDDDDEWLPDYLQTCKNAILENKNIIAVFCQLIWRTNETDEIHDLTIEKLTQENFYIGNPGVQGSNTFINSKIFNELNGFDESFPNSNDRELMIRLLDYIENENNKLECKVIEIPLVIHYNHTDIKVNNNFKSKKVALESITRAKKYFHYEYEE
jgi:glycosyltransferase involved in cell wall biosynthesis